MDGKELPARPSLEQYRKQAKDLLKAYKAGTPQAIESVRAHHPHADKFLSSAALKAKFVLADAQLIIAREHGSESWPKFVKHVQMVEHRNSAAASSDPVADFIEAASVPMDSHQSGALEGAEMILAAHPELTANNIYAAASLADENVVRRLLGLDARYATTKGGPRGWDALTYLCFSRYLRLEPARSENFLRSASALLDAGASADTGYFDSSHRPEPEFESALYGAAGVARNAELTRLLVARGADVNNGEVIYHAPEGYDNRVLKVLLESGKLSPDSLATMLQRKHDMHDYNGIKLLLEHGADPNHMTRWRRTAVHQAALRDNSLAIFELLLDHGANPEVMAEGKSGIAMAARRGRGDLLDLFERRGISVELEGAEALLAACARHDAATVRAIAACEPEAVKGVLSSGGKVLAEFAGVGNTGGVRHLLDLGMDAGALFAEGDNYWDVAKNSTALHVAAWRARHDTVKFLVERNAPIDLPDEKGRTPLALAVRACVDSYWTNLRSPESVEVLLSAGASVSGIDYPSGYAKVDKLLQHHSTDRARSGRLD